MVFVWGVIPTIGFWRYVTSSTFGQAVMENWQSELLAVAPSRFSRSSCASAARPSRSLSAPRPLT